MTVIAATRRTEGGLGSHSLHLYFYSATLLRNLSTVKLLLFHHYQSVSEFLLPVQLILPDLLAWWGYLNYQDWSQGVPGVITITYTSQGFCSNKLHPALPTNTNNSVDYCQAQLHLQLTANYHFNLSSTTFFLTSQQPAEKVSAQLQ